MAKLRLIKPGQSLWDVHNYRDGANRPTRGVWRVEVLEVHDDYALCSWNGNAPKKYWCRDIERLRVREPKQ